ncbi:E3 ubiquitin-protein ligase TRIM37 [Fasciola hepatica]|uniref:E3 ubiquitin-protein ligase TRIM37 n=1 Tax=Fasciola hepatica TaxID=6192 RepID=A0A4E0QVT3_FASHE|nr:E3 ubiquitin-protein ligase TRIM37 [Fasciola hepatica]
MASASRSQKSANAEPFEVESNNIFSKFFRVFRRFSDVLFVWKSCTMLVCVPIVQSFVATNALEASLHIYELINCRWADEVTQQLDNLQSQALSARQSSQNDCTPGSVGDR